MNAQSDILWVPYGISSFEEMRSGELAFVDKTKAIAELEASRVRFPILIRPRRFGKTLFTGMLQAYYDKAAASDFDAVFEGTYISRHKTPLQGQFYVVRFDFSGITATADLIGNFNERLLIGMASFFERYPTEGARELLNSTFSSPDRLWSAFIRMIMPRVGKKLYVIIDEYDQFANNILIADRRTFEEMTSPNGWLKNFYTSLKAATVNVLSRAFITGVTPISLDSLTSGFNIATRISQAPWTADWVGFREEELKTLIAETVDLSALGLKEEDVIRRMKDFYKGYRFCPDNRETVFNTSMCLYYLRELRAKGREPDELIDSPNHNDLEKIGRIFSLSAPEDAETIAESVINGRSIEIKPSILSSTINLQNRKRLSYEDTISLLFFMGYLTFSPEAGNRLVCPNKAVKSQFFEYFSKKAGGLTFPSLS